MRATTSGIALALGAAFCAVFCSMRAAAQKAAQVCPVSVENLELTYSHAGGRSTPQLAATLGNRTGKRIASARFRLSILNASGDPHFYPEDPVYRKRLDAGKQRHFIWTLDLESVDIHRTGEELVLLEVEFDDLTRWKDDGSESCGSAVDYHAR